MAVLKSIFLESIQIHLWSREEALPGEQAIESVDKNFRPAARSPD
jgi:hypothetical protein